MTSSAEKTWQLAIASFVTMMLFSVAILPAVSSLVVEEVTPAEVDTEKCEEAITDRRERRAINPSAGICLADEHVPNVSLALLKADARTSHERDRHNGHGTHLRT